MSEKNVVQKEENKQGATFNLKQLEKILSERKVWNPYSAVMS